MRAYLYIYVCICMCVSTKYFPYSSHVLFILLLSYGQVDSHYGYTCPSNSSNNINIMLYHVLYVNRK